MLNYLKMKQMGSSSRQSPAWTVTEYCNDTVTSPFFTVVFHMILKGSPKSFWDSTYSKLRILPQIDEPLIITVLIYPLDSEISPFDFDGIG